MLPPASQLAVRQAASSKSLRTFPQELTPAQTTSKTFTILDTLERNALHPDTLTTGTM